VVAVRRTLTAWGETPPLDENEREWARLLRLSEQGWIRMHIGQGTRQVEILKPLIGKFHSLEPGRSHSDLLEPLLARGESVRPDGLTESMRKRLHRSNSSV